MQSFKIKSIRQCGGSDCCNFSELLINAGFILTEKQV